MWPFLAFVTVHLYICAGSWFYTYTKTFLYISIIYKCTVTRFYFEGFHATSPCLGEGHR
jgi:hypothetical protein